MSKKTIEERYKKLTQREHVLLRPATYIGSITSELKEMFSIDTNVNDIVNIDDIKIEKKLINYNPGFLKIFDEILSNASDHHLRTGKVKYINIDVFDDYIQIENDGPGIPVEIHKEHKMYIGEMLFGNLLTGENYDESDERTGVGQNGIGAKATAIYSNQFILETCDGKKKYVQEFNDNLLNIQKPVISKSKKNYTKITYYPDFEKFGIEKNDENIKKLFLRRVLDIAAFSPKLKIKFNGLDVSIKSFEKYSQLFLTEDDELFYERLSDKWEVSVGYSNDGFQQVSMVNSNYTLNGGTHVNFITNQIVKELKTQLEKKHKKVTIKENDIKSKLFIFLNSTVVNPTFDSQTKETLVTRLTNKHTAGIQVSPKLIKQIMNSEIIEDIMNYIQIKERAELKKLNKGKKGKVRVRKLDDANKAGTTKSEQCTLFLAEGDSASSTIITGFATTGRDYYGVFPLKGKPLNVRKSAMKKILENDEIKNVISALGLEFGEKYTDVSDLRYGKVVFAGDADDDGTHIKGLLINLFEFFWPELLKLDFLYDFVTPIVKIEKGKKVKFFYKLNDYDKWKKTNTTGWFVTYYKGLGTIEASEIKEFFKTINKFLIPFNYGDENPHNVIDLAFNEKRSDDRKDWLNKYEPGMVVDKFVDTTTYETFFNKEFIEFSMADNIRSIPSVIDGFKPSQRKVLYTLFKKKYKNKVKVSQFAGAVTEETAYHHGPMSLEGAIINMAQDFIGTNNINLLEPKGAFGTRLKGGKDAASSRYIFTMLSELSKDIFQTEDNPILNYLNDDGFPIEPDYYVPIIPMILVNGAEGIGTGWSTSIMNYKPEDIIKYLVMKIKDKKLPEILPYFKGFKGKIIYDADKNRYTTQGVITAKSATQLKISELPIGMWNDKYYTILDGLEDGKIIKSYTKNDTDEKVDITISINRGELKNIEGHLISLFKLETHFSMNNMMLFDSENKIKHYKSVDDIISDFYDVRLDFYQQRKDYQIAKLEHEKVILINKMKFINEILKGNLEIQNKKRVQIEEKMVELHILKIDDSYNYLLNMSLLSLTKEKLFDLKNIFNNKKSEIELLNKTSIKQIWLKELNILFKQFKK